MNNFATFNRLMAQSITTLVDERVRGMIPYLKEQMAIVEGKEEI